MLYRKHTTSTFSQLIAIIFIIIALTLLILSVGNFTKNNDVVSIETERDTIEKYAIQCYASEGSYPPNLEYLEENYSLILHREKFEYYYEAFASNIMPTISVTPKMDRKKSINQEEPGE